MLFLLTCVQLWDLMDSNPPGSSVHGNSPGQNTGVGYLTSSVDLPNPGVEPSSPALKADSLPFDPPGKPKTTRVGSLSFLQGNFLTQESNRDLLHCRQILYQLSHQGSTRTLEWVAYPFLQGIFLTQESNRDLLHCTWILYQLSYQGSPRGSSVIILKT